MAPVRRPTLAEDLSDVLRLRHFDHDEHGMSTTHYLRALIALQARDHEGALLAYAQAAYSERRERHFYGDSAADGVDWCEYIKGHLKGRIAPRVRELARQAIADAQESKAARLAQHASGDAPADEAACQDAGSAQPQATAKMQWLGRNW